MKKEERERNIHKILKDLVHYPSITCTEKEKSAAECVLKHVREIPYFQQNVDLCGEYIIENDTLGRNIPYGLVRGKGDKTLVFSGHYDVVSAKDYGILETDAFEIDTLPEKLKELDLSTDFQKDLESGEWIFGRGTADMKGGLSICIQMLREFSEIEDRAGNILFYAVPDEESYSVGMRSSMKFLMELQEKYGLQYEFLIDPEPNYRENGKHIVPIGTGGKALPVILVQGRKAHISKCFSGLNPIGILSEIFQRTELSMEFVDKFEGDVTVPPTWNWFKDRKEEYDVSVPERASGYFSVISFSTTPSEILEKLDRIARESFEAYVSKMHDLYEEYKTMGRIDTDEEIHYEPKVMNVSELIAECKKTVGSRFDKVYKEIYEKMKKEIKENRLNFPQATICMMEELLRESKIQDPVVVIGFAPPYYIPVHSFHIPGKEEISPKCYEIARKYAEENFSVTIVPLNYTPALSDCSYCASDKPFDYQKFACNTPLWGDMYQIPFEEIEKLNIPFLVLGPWGKDYHTIQERVNKKSLYEEMPEIYWQIINAVLGE